MTSSSSPPRSTVKRLPARASYDTPTVHAILDAGLVAHVGFVVDGQPFVIPMAYARRGGTLYLHGAPASRLQKILAEGGPVVVTVTLIDGLVLARSAFHHSMNYRSVVAFGRARSVLDASEKKAAFDALVDHVVPGRSARVRPPDAKEAAGTHVLAFEIEEASAKIRTGPPKDDEEDRDLPVWAGEIPLPVLGARPVDDSLLPTKAAPTDEEQAYRRP